MNPSSIVLRVPLTSKANVGAMNQRTLVRSLLFFIHIFLVPTLVLLEQIANGIRVWTVMISYSSDRPLLCPSTLKKKNKVCPSLLYLDNYPSVSRLIVVAWSCVIYVLLLDNSFVLHNLKKKRTSLMNVAKTVRKKWDSCYKMDWE